MACKHLLKLVNKTGQDVIGARLISLGHAVPIGIPERLDTFAKAANLCFHRIERDLGRATITWPVVAHHRMLENLFDVLTLQGMLGQRAVEHLDVFRDHPLVRGSV